MHLLDFSTNGETGIMPDGFEAALDGAMNIHDLLLAFDRADEKLPSTIRNWLFLLLYDLATEHHGALLILVRTGTHLGSALALLRPLWEVSLRGVWVARCASDDQLVGISKHLKRFPGLTAIARAVQESLATLGPGLGNFYNTEQAYIDQLHAFTHGGVEALIERINGPNVQAAYKPQTISQLLRQSTYYVVLIAIVRAQVVSGSWQILSPEAGCIIERYSVLFKAE